MTKKVKFKKTELKEFERRLLRDRERILKEIEYDSGQLAVTQTEASGDLSAYSNHMADQGTETARREVSSQILSQQRTTLFEIDLALRKISQGTYGICEVCGRLIEKKRLKILPQARHCIKCAKK